VPRYYYNMETIYNLATEWPRSLYRTPCQSDCALACVWEVLVSNLGQQYWLTCPRFIMVFHNPSTQILGHCLKLSHDHFHPHSFQFIISASFNAIQSKVLKVLLNKTYIHK
jgi:hypothetical protein